MKPSQLYMIATPLGNRNDITLRALEMLKTLEVFFAEDSRELSKLLDLHAIPRNNKRIHSYASHNMKEATERALEILRTGISIGFVSDRGTPGISDPGALLVREARQAGIDVVPIPGPSSVVAALSVSGTNSDRFVFLGFLPLAPKDRAALWDGVRKLDLTTCFFESPKRIRETLQELQKRFPNGSAFLAREMTKVYEAFTFVPLTRLDPESAQERGEYVVVFEPGAVAEAEGAEEPWAEELRLRLAPDKEWAKAVAARFSVGASEVYNALQKRKKDG